MSQGSSDAELFTEEFPRRYFHLLAQSEILRLVMQPLDVLEELLTWTFPVNWGILHQELIMHDYLPRRHFETPACIAWEAWLFGYETPAYEAREVGGSARDHDCTLTLMEVVGTTSKIGSPRVTTKVAQNGDKNGALTIANLPVPQLESLKFKANQIIESINALQHTLNAYPGWMYAWPDILSKYNVLLSQTHNFSTALLQPFPTSTATTTSTLRAPAPPAGNIYERIALHPRSGMTDTQLDTEVTPLLRNQQTTDVLRQENDTVRRLAEHMNTRGSLGVLGLSNPPAPLGGFGVPKKPEYEDVLAECNEIRDAHDRRVDRAVRAVAMLREKFDWKQRVEVEVEEPEELEWDPRLGRRSEGALNPVAMDDAVMDDESSGDEDDEEEGGGEGNGGDNSDEEDADDIEGALVNPEATSPSAGDVTEGFGSITTSTATLNAVEPIDVDSVDMS